MRARNRDINVFSLSMVDMISGAMGAFLIIMIILSRYYKSDPNNSKSVEQLEQELQSAQERLDRIRKMFESDFDPAQLLEELEGARREIEQAQLRMADLQDRLDQASSQIDRLDNENQGLRSENKDLEKKNNSLEKRKPYLVEVYWNCADVNVDMYLYTSIAGAGGTRMQPFHPTKQQFAFFTGDQYVNDPSGPGTDVWLNRDTSPGIEYRLYYKIMGAQPQTLPCPVNGGIFGSFPDVSIEQVTLSGKVPWLFVGTIREDNSGVPKFVMATDKERETERKTVETRLKQEGRP